MIIKLVITAVIIILFLVAYYTISGVVSIYRDLAEIREKLEDVNDKVEILSKIKGVE